ncbi:hypothetical protein [uncultured Zoogloea sp.]|uniref:hypothetical protein n=1 Tax=uncultured Zoogloea sp. TaxID=160237 RepID=UPI00260BDF93|nr:hypothetical protein [uncultured Zoogloea sp.]
MSQKPKPDLLQKLDELSTAMANAVEGAPRALVLGAALAVAIDAAEQATDVAELIALRGAAAKGIAHLDTIIERKTS